MAREDFKDGAEPIDMEDYPYQVGDKLPGGITIIEVTKGDNNDSFAGYLVKPIVDIRGIKKIYGDPFVLKVNPHKDKDGRLALADPGSWPEDAPYGLEMVGPVGEPYAQRVMYRIDKKGYNVTPEEFLAIAKGEKPVVPEPEEKTASDTDEEEGWTPGDDELITENYKTMSDADMAKILECDVNALKRHRLDDLGLKKNPGGA